MGGSAVLWEGQLLSHLDDVESQLGVAARRDLEEFDRRAVDALGPREFFEADLLQNHALRLWPGPFTQRLDRVSDPAARRYLQTLIHSDLASEPGQTSIPYGLHNYLMNRPEYLRLYSIVGGNERLIDALVDRLDAEIRLSHRVVAISANSGGDYTLELQSDTGRFRFRDCRAAQPGVAVVGIPGGGLAAGDRAASEASRPSGSLSPDHVAVRTLFLAVSVARVVLHARPV
jgi:hypothetical protein